jgi:hypothetical protein
MRKSPDLSPRFAYPQYHSRLLTKNLNLVEIVDSTWRRELKSEFLNGHPSFEIIDQVDQGITDDEIEDSHKAKDQDAFWDSLDCQPACSGHIEVVDND